MNFYDKFRLDYVFSYWIFAWFILYYYKIVKSLPLFILLIAIIENSFLFIIHIINFICVCQIKYKNGNLIFIKY